jgi:hypothetical protein
MRVFFSANDYCQEHCARYSDIWLESQLGRDARFLDCVVGKTPLCLYLILSCENAWTVESMEDSSISLLFASNNTLLCCAGDKGEL